MREWLLTVIAGVVIIGVTIAISIAMVLVFHTFIWQSLSEDARNIILPIGLLLLLVINVVANLVAIPAGVVQIRQLISNPEQKRTIERRRNFADYIEHEIRRLGLLEEWRDYRYTELEAEVEAEGSRKIFRTLPFSSQTKNNLRREKSLSRALEYSKERLILVEGEPGSGKSIALRHVAEKMARNARKSRDLKSVIPIYVNLKELERPKEAKIDRNLIEAFILKSLMRINDRDVEKFLDDEFFKGLENAAWFFLFDSFDEIPDILSSTETDATIKAYGNAIADFLSGMNRCRGIVASRQYRGPKHFTWSRFRILSLSESRQLKLIKKAQLDPNLEVEFIGKLGNANQEIRSMASNPLFINLLCEHAKNGNAFPDNTHTVFEAYINNRLDRDAKRLQRRFNLNSIQLRAAAESVAFCMASDNNIGLSPTRESLWEAVSRLNMEVNADFETLLDALEYIKLARPEVALYTGKKTFTFAHRRFQEYFATCVVLREPSRVLPKELLTNARWRETAVVMCQTQLISELTLVLEQVILLLTDFSDNVSDLINEPLEYIRHKEQNTKSFKAKTLREVFSWFVGLLLLLRLLQSSFKDRHLRKPFNIIKEYFSQLVLPVMHQKVFRGNFSWPVGLHHLLGLLQDGFGSRINDLPDTIRMYISQFILNTTELRPLDDRKWSLEVAGTVHESVLVYILKDAFSSQSQWLKEVAYRQAARLSSITPDIAQGIRNAIVELAMSDRLRQEQYATKAHLDRLHHSISKNFISAMWLLVHLPVIDFGWYVIFLFYSLSISYLIPFQIPWIIMVLILSGLLFIGYFSSWKLVRNPWLISDYVTKLLVVCLIRLSLLTASLFYALAFAKSIDTSTIFLICLGFSIILLIPLAFIAAKFGFITFWPLWTFLPFWPILWLLLYLLSFLVKIPLIINSMIRNYDKIINVIFILFIFVSSTFLTIKLLSILGAFNNSVIYLIVPGFDNYLTQINLDINATILAIIYIITFFIGLIRLAQSIIGDLHRWIKWLRNDKKQITCDELWDETAGYQYPNWFSRRVIKLVRERDMLVLNHETEQYLKKIAIEIETKLLFAKDHPFISFFFNIFLKKKVTTNFDKLIEKSNAAILDEIYQLLESAQIKGMMNK